jgi:Penicillin amidase
MLSATNAGALDESMRGWVNPCNNLRWVVEIELQDALSASAKERLSAWDCSMDADAVAPTIYSAFRGRLMRLMVRPWTKLATSLVQRQDMN